MLALRLPFAASSGAFVTLAVFSLLWHFVSIPLDAGPARQATKIDWTRTRVDTPVVPRRDEKTQRPPPPQIPDAPRTGTIDGVGPPTMFTKPRFEPARFTRPDGVPLRPDGDVIPIVRQPPEYPPREATKGTEGWVQVRFTVTTIGTVRDAVVVAAEPERVFDDAALKAIARWRYNPKVEDGVAVERVGLQTIIRFEMQK
jgi:periplasmic protein TonB